MFIVETAAKIEAREHGDRASVPALWLVGADTERVKFRHGAGAVALEFMRRQKTETSRDAADNFLWSIVKDHVTMESLPFFGELVGDADALLDLVNRRARVVMMAAAKGSLSYSDVQDEITAMEFLYGGIACGDHNWLTVNGYLADPDFDAIARTDFLKPEIHPIDEMSPSENKYATTYRCYDRTFRYDVSHVNIYTPPTVLPEGNAIVSLGNVVNGEFVHVIDVPKE